MKINESISKKTRLLIFYLVALVLFCGLSLYLANADPGGASITGSPTVDSGPTRTPTSRNDVGGNIITLALSLEQQDAAWKAYVGNVSGTYVLQNANNKSIYEWPLGSTVTGEVYLSRNNSVNWTSGAITCATSAEMITEQAVLGMNSSATDNINSTFNATSHASFSVGTNSIANSSCRSIALWVNDTFQSPGESALFQEITLHDGNNLVYASLINNDRQGYDNSSMFDFQTIIAENRTASTGTTYYFYVELGN